MDQTYLYNYLRRIKLTRGYVALALVYGVSTLLIPFGSQFLVNTLALTGLSASTSTFLIIIGLGLAFSLFVKYMQVVLLEFIQRNLLFRELADWQRKVPEDDQDSPYFFEMFSMLKSFSTIVSDGVDLLLKTLFGGLALAFIHPGFMLISVIFVLFLYRLRAQGRGAIVASLEESSRKYDLYYQLENKACRKNESPITEVFRSRDKHFGYLKRQTRTVYMSFFVVQMILLIWGIYLIQQNQLSLGQFVSAEIIVSNIFVSFLGVPKLIDYFYDFETSCIKLDSLEKAPKQ